MKVAVCCLFLGECCSESRKGWPSLVRPSYFHCRVSGSPRAPAGAEDCSWPSRPHGICLAHWAVLSRTLASARVKDVRELVVGVSLLEEAKSQLDAWWASGCQQDRCIKSGLWEKFSQAAVSKLLSILL